LNKFDRFCYKYERFGIRNLMMYVIISNAVIFFLRYIPELNQILNYLYFSPQKILEGEIWRIVTFAMIPPNSSPIFIIITLYFYYLIGRSLESEWGVLKFNIFYFSGCILTMIYCLISGYSGDAYYINLSLFFAFATIYPDFEVVLFFFIPIKIKYLAILDAVLFVIPVLKGNIIPLIAVLNYFLFFIPEYKRFFKERKFVQKNRSEFKRNMKTAQKSYMHKCSLCGITDADDPTMEFRYCGSCANYACYCIHHINNHEHIVDADFKEI